MLVRMVVLTFALPRGNVTDEACEQRQRETAAVPTLVIEIVRASRSVSVM